MALLRKIFRKSKGKEEQGNTDIKVEISVENSESEVSESGEEATNRHNETDETSEEFDVDKEIESIIKETCQISSIINADINVPKTYSEFIDAAIERTIDYFTVSSPEILNMYDNNSITIEYVEKSVKKYIKGNIHIEGFEIKSNEDVERVYQGFSKFIWGYDVIERLIDDEDISDIAVLAKDNVMIKVNGKRKQSDIKFRTDSSLVRFVEHVAIKNRKSISEIDAMQWFVDGKSSDKFRLRFTISTGTVTTSGLPYISIRKIPKTKHGIDWYIEKGFITRELYEYIVKRLRRGHGLNISGKAGEGKTMFLNELIDTLPHDKRYDCIQDNEELFSDTHPNIMFHKTVEPQGESRVRYDMSKELRHGLVADLDGFILGEVKGKEAAVLAHGTYTGHQALCTSHANSAGDSLYKIADYAREESGEEMESFLPKLASLDTLVHIKDFKIDEVLEVDHYDRKTKTFEFKKVDIKKGCVIE